jgi:hypothetical protein
MTMINPSFVLPSPSKRAIAPRAAARLALGAPLVLGFVAGCSGAPAESHERAANTVEALSIASVTITSQQLGGRCLDTYGMGSVNNTRVDIYDCWGGTNQSWMMLSDGTIRGIGGRCLDANGVSANPAAAPNGTVVQIYDCWGGPNQKWSYTADGEIRLAGTSKCLDSNGSNDSSMVQIWDCLGGTNQHWNIQNAATPTIAEFSWDQTMGHPTVMWPVDQGLCVLTGVTGYFDGSGEDVEVADWNHTWVLTGSSQQQGVGGRAKCITWADLGGYGYNTQPYSAEAVSGGFETHQQLWQDDSFCTLSRLNGKLVNPGTYGSVTLDGASHSWQLTAYDDASPQDHSFMLAGATCVGLKIPHSMWLTGNDATWNSSDAGTPQYLTEVNEGFCGLQDVTGSFHGSGEHVDIVKIGTGWYLTGATMQPGSTAARAACMKLHQY